MIPGFVLYSLLAILVAYFGRNRKFGFWAYLILAFLFSPVIAFIIVLASDKRKPSAVTEVEVDGATA